MVGVGLRKYSEEIGLKVVDGSVCGKYQGFFVRMDDLAGFKRIEIKISPLDDEQLIKLDNFINTNKGKYRISSYSVLPTGLSFYISDTVGTIGIIRDFLPVLFENLTSIEAKPLSICSICNEKVNGMVFYSLKGDSTIIGHRACLEKPEEKTIEKQIAEMSKSYGSGFFGAFLGMVVGIIPWILISLAGFIAAFGGFILSAVIKFGYEKTGGKVGRPKITAIILFSVLGVILATLFSYTIYAYNYWTAEGEVITILDAFISVLYNISQFAILEFLGDLGLGLLFTALGSWKFISQEYRDIKNATLQPVAYILD